MMRVAEVWRYPVKSMRGESLAALRVTADGVEGDREYVFESSGAPPGMLRLTGRERAAMLGYAAVGSVAGVRVRTPAGREFGVEDPELIREFGSENEFRLVREHVPQTDCRPLALVSVATIAALAAELGSQLDPRRFRANFYLDGVEAFAEEAWVGRRVQLGKALVEVTERDPRCRFFSLDPDTAEPMPALMKLLDRRHGGRAGVYARVVRGGRVSAGDEVVCGAE